MDPNAAFRLWKGADPEDAAEHARNLLEWLRKGGFEPNWSEKEKQNFFNWCAQNRLLK